MSQVKEQNKVPEEQLSEVRPLIKEFRVMIVNMI